MKDSNLGNDQNSTVGEGDLAPWAASVVSQWPLFIVLSLYLVS